MPLPRSRHGCRETLLDEEIKKGKLVDSYDIIIIPGDAKCMITGEGIEEHNKKTNPKYVLPKYPPEFRSGLGKEGVEKLKEYAGQLSLDRKRFDQALDTDKFAPLIQRDLMEGLNLGINSTPTIYLNGKRIDDRTYETLKSAISTALKSAEKNRTMPGQPLLRIEDNTNLRLEVTVREQDIPQVRPGKDVKVQIDALQGREIAGRVAQVVSASDVRTHSFIVKIDVPAEKGLITGMYGKALFSIGKHEALLIPRSAVVEMSGITGVYIASPEGTARFQMVQTGGEQGDQIEVRNGLQAGDRVVADQRSGRIEGRKVVAVQN